MSVFQFGLFFIAIGVFSGFTLKDWRVGVWTFLIWLVCEDLVRKFMGNDMTIYFAKDVLVGVTYLSYYLSRRQRKIPPLKPVFWTALLLLFIWSSIEVLNPNSPSLWYGVMGMKIYFYYVPLMFLGYGMFRSEKELRRLLLFTVGFAGVIALLGSIQAVSDPGFLNPAVLAPDIRELSSLTRMSFTNGRFSRPTSVFVSDGRFAAYLLMTWLIAVGTTTYCYMRRLSGKRYPLLSLALITAAMILGGGRTSLVLASASMVLLAIGFFWGLPWEHFGGRRAAKGFVAATLATVLGVWALMTIYPDSASSRLEFYQQTLSPSSEASQLVDRVWVGPANEIVKAFAYPSSILGYGTGTCSLGGQYVARILDVPRLDIGVESGFGTIILEMGLLGLVLWLCWTAALLISAWRVLKNLRGTVLFPIGLVIVVFAFVVLIPYTAQSNSGYQNFVVNAYFWFLLGILYRLPGLLRDEVISSTLQAAVPRHISTRTVPAR